MLMFLLDEMDGGDGNGVDKMDGDGVSTGIVSGLGGMEMMI